MPIVLKSGSLNLLELSVSVQACNGIDLHLPLTAVHHIEVGMLHEVQLQLLIDFIMLLIASEIHYRG